MHREQLCRKRPVVAVLVTPSSEVFIGGNRITRPQPVCPRNKQGFEDGEGWHLCKEMCGQNAHAEIDALNQAGEKARGGTLYLIGHWTACDDCAGALAEHGVSWEIVTVNYDAELLRRTIERLRPSGQKASEAGGRSC
jgi:tRNA(Arg) A34 adenosine deaminase TadA